MAAGDSPRLARSERTRATPAPVPSTHGLARYASQPAEKQTAETRRTVMFATRSRRGENLGPSKVLPNFPVCWMSGTHFSPDDRLTFYVPFGEPALYLARRRPDGNSYDCKRTNLPGPAPGVHSDAFPLAVSNDGAIVFTQEEEGKAWLAGSRTPSGGPLEYDTPMRLLDLQLPSPSRHPYTFTLSQDARLLVGWLNGELIAMRLPEDVREKVLHVLRR